MAASLLSVAGLASAATLDTVEIQLAGVDIAYDSGTASVTDGGAPEDDLDGIFFITSASTDSLIAPTADISIDLEIPGVPAIPAAGGSVTAPAGGSLTLFAPNLILDLDLGSADIIYSPVAGIFNFVFVGTIAEVAGQDLPFDLGLVTDDITVTFSTQADLLTASSTEVTSFTASGTGEIRGEFDPNPDRIPEPTSLALLALVGAGVAVARRV